MSLPPTWQLDLVTLDGTLRARGIRTERGFTIARAPLGRHRLILGDGRGGIVREETVTIERGELTRTWTLPTGGLELLGLPPGASVSLVAIDLVPSARDRSGGEAGPAQPPIERGSVVRRALVPESGAVRWSALPAGRLEWIASLPSDGASPLHLRRGEIEIDDRFRSVIVPPERPLPTRIEVTGLPTDRPLPEVRLLPRLAGDARAGDRSRLRRALRAPVRPLGPGSLETTVETSAGDAALLLSWPATRNDPAMTIELPVAIDGSPRRALTSPPWVETQLRARRHGGRLVRGSLTLRSAPSEAGIATARATCAVRLDANGEGRVRLPVGRWTVSLDGGTTHTIEVTPASPRFDLTF